VLLVEQPAVSDSLLLAEGSLDEDGPAPSEVDAGGRQVAQAMVVMVVV
jgi:hypothetical protein